MIECCRAWGGMTLEEWAALPREDQELRIALHRAEAQPHTAEELEKLDRQREREQRRAERRMASYQRRPHAR